MADKDKKEEKPQAAEPSAPAAPTFKIVSNLLAGDNAYKLGEEAKLLAEKETVGIATIAHWIRNGDIKGEFPGLKGLDANPRNDQPATRKP